MKIHKRPARYQSTHYHKNKMMKTTKTITLLLSFAAAAQALNCWVCDNARTNDECIQRGRLDRCQANQLACQTEVRRGSFGILVSKRCKQAHACDNNFIQNPRAAWSPSQCNSRTPSSVCRCCCNFDECNKPSLDCQERPDVRPRARTNELSCFQPREPTNGNKKCTLSRVASKPRGRVAIGTECKFTCDADYQLVGANATMCDRHPRQEIARFNRRPPICRPTTCIRQQVAPESGSIICTNGRRIGSSCTFQCDVGYSITGSPSTRCQPSRRWTNRAPTCVLITCSPPHTDPTNGLVTCSDANKQGSECRFECVFGNALVGFPLSECQEDYRNPGNGRWTTRAPVCQLILCPAHVAPSDGSMECTKGRNVESVCEFSCKKGFVLLGSSESTCQDDGNDDTIGKWSSPAPRCQAILCPAHVAPSDGSMECTKGRNVESVCEFSCKKGFVLLGSSESTCQDDGNDDTIGKWSSSAPRCQAILCPAHVAPSDGSMECTKGRNVESVCEFSCKKGFVLLGSSESTCQDDGNDDTIGEWSSSAPRCQAVRCQPRHTELSGGSVSCSNDNLEGSICNFRCSGDLELVGIPASQCRDDDNGDALGQWTSPAPTCLKAIVCPEQRAPRNGAVSCDLGFSVDSECTFVCELGYNLVGEDRSICRESPFDVRSGEWSSSSPTCEPIRCLPPHSAPASGSVICTDENRVYSSCGFFCDIGYGISGEEFSQCDVDGKWSSPPPTCERIECPLRVDSPEFGSVTCTNNNFAGSECTFRCNPGYEMIGNIFAACQFDGVWSGPDPICKQLFCGIPPEARENSFRTCSDELILGSLCEYTCLPNHRRVGSQFSNCVTAPVGLRWNNPAPSCVQIECPLRVESTAFGQVSCTNKHYAGSICTFTCDEGYGLSGDARVTCRADGSWSSRDPFCERLSCPPAPQALENSARQCSSGNLFGSACEYTCLPNHRRIGTPISTCVIGPDGLRWNNPAPSCTPVTCEELGPISNGEMSCSNEEFVGSVCTIECNEAEGYALYPPLSDQSTCLPNNSWDKPAPCCARQCPPYAVMDLILVLDSSSSIGDANWEIMKTFIRRIIESFYISSNVSRVAVIRYNRRVDRRSQILLRDFPDDREGLLAAFDDIPYSGRGTRTGSAVQYVSDVILQPDNGDRLEAPNVVLVITDGQAQDGDVLRNASIELRERGVLTYGVGVQPPQGQLDRNQLLDIAGSQDHLLIAESGFAELDEALSLKLSEQICENRCIDDYNRLFGHRGSSQSQTTVNELPPPRK